MDENQTYNLILRTIDSDDLPDVENYVRSLHKKGYFMELISKGKFTVEELQKLPISKRCEIFFRKEGQQLKTGDIRIFRDTGDYSVFLGSGG